MLCAICYMKISDYIEKLRKKPEKEKERVAIIATAISFLLILAIWMISFSETNRGLEAENSPNAQTQFQNLNNNFKEGKQSIQDMLQQVPDQSNLAPETTAQNNSTGEENMDGSFNAQVEPQAPPAQDEVSQNQAPDGNQEQIPQLP